MHFGFVMMVMDFDAALRALWMVLLSSKAASSSSVVELISVVRSALERTSSYHSS